MAREGMTIDWRREPPVRERVYFGLIFVLCVFIMAKMWWGPVQKKVVEVNSQRKSVELQSDALKNLIAATKKQVRKVTDVKGREVEVATSDARVKRILAKQAANAAEEIALVIHLMTSYNILGNLAFRGVDVGPPREAATYVIVPLKIFVEGTFSSVGRYIRRIETIERPLIVNGLKLMQISNRLGIVNAELSVYLYTQKGSIVRRSTAKE